MKKFFLNNGWWLTMMLGMLLLIDTSFDWLPKSSNAEITYIIYGTLIMLPLSLSIYFNNKK
tara:strand:- start:81 stop:263 length:183 start_codon:yes stop_codon:yes gene_type:complete